MKIFGHPWIESETFYRVSSIDEIATTPPNSLLEIASLTSETLPLLKHCQAEKLRYAVHITTITEAIYAHNFGATLVLCEKELAMALMPIAQNYLFDTQVVAMAKEEAIELLAKANVDGVKLN